MRLLTVLCLIMISTFADAQSSDALSLQTAPEEVILTGIPGIFKCRTISAGSVTYNNKPFPGFHSGDTMTTQVVLQTSAISYPQIVDNGRGYGCALAWNFMFGGSRCGYSMDPNLNSDRFVWRNHPDCIYNSTTPVGNFTSSASSNSSSSSNNTASYNGTFAGYKKICIHTSDAQLGAYSVDGGVPSVYIFNTTITAGAIYTLRLRFYQESTIYEILAGDGIMVLESYMMQHSFCYEYAQGGNADIKLGKDSIGDCAAPSDMSVCFSQDPATWGTEAWRRSHVV